MNDDEQLELDIPEEPLTEEGLEEDIKRNEERRQKEYDEVTKGNEELRRRQTRRGRGGETQLDIPGLFEARSGLRTTLGLGTEIFLNTLVDPFFEPGTQVAAGTAINFLAQRIRGGELSKGELAAAGLASLIPGGAQGRAITQFAKGSAKGALSGAIETAGMAGIDQGRLPTAEELAAGIGIGAAFGGALSTPQARKALQEIADRAKGKFTPITVYAASPSDSGFNLPTGDAEFKLRPETPFYRTLNPDAQESLRKFARSNLNKDSWEDLGLAAKYEGVYDQADWDRYLQKTLDAQDQAKFMIRVMNQIYTDQELKTGDLTEFGVRLADMFGLPEPIDAAGLQRIIDNEGGIIYLRTPRMRRNRVPAIEVTNLQQLTTAIEERLADIATDPYFEYGHIRAVLNILQDNDAINNANFLGNFQPEPTRSIVRSLFRRDLDELLEGPVESVVEEFGNRATQARADLDLNVNRIEGSPASLEESFLNFMKPELDVANAVPVQLRQRLADDYMAQVAEEGADMAAYGIDLNDPETPFNIDDINLAVFKQVLSKYKSGGVSLLQILQIDEYIKLFREFPELAEEFLTVRPGSSGDFAINYLSNLRLTTQQRNLLRSLRKKIEELSPIKQSTKKIKKKESEAAKYNIDPIKKPKKKFKKKKDDDDDNLTPV